MIKQSTYQVFLIRVSDWWVRMTFQGKNKREQRKYLATLGKDIVHLGTLPLPIKSDVDLGSGEGQRLIGKSRLVTCHHCTQMITKKRTQETFLEVQRKSIVSIRESQEEYLRKRC